MRSRSIVVALAAAACTTSRSTPDDAGAVRVDARPDVAISASAAAVPDANVNVNSNSNSSSIVGEWERQTEPYKGMRVAIDGSGSGTTTTMRALVTAAPPVTPERLAFYTRSAPSSVAKAQLECQRGLWKPGDELMTAMADGGARATILVRDWGFTGTCRHADSRAPAELVVSSTGELTISVTSRGKTATQQWTRVSP